MKGEDWRMKKKKNKQYLIQYDMKKHIDTYNKIIIFKILINK